MYKDKYIFVQLVEFLDCFKFRRIVNKYQGDRCIKSFSRWNQLLVMMFGQLAECESLRNLFDRLNINNVNERSGFSEPSLFDF
ncbi:MAG: DUF4372 domain-containing protein [Fermentimonas sp.]|jgi:hypothetical protein